MAVYVIQVKETTVQVRVKEFKAESLEDAILEAESDEWTAANGWKVQSTHTDIGIDMDDIGIDMD